MKHVDHSTKSQCVLWYHELKSLTAVQLIFRNEFGQDPPHTDSIKQETLTKRTMCSLVP